jgi:hypothetical protein
MYKKKQLLLDPGTKLSDSFLVFMCYWIQLELKLDISVKQIRQLSPW